MDIKSMLLGFLMRGSMTGYELKKKFTISFAFFSGVSYGSIYPALKKMEQEGLVALKVEIQDGAPNRKVYTITEAGRKAFLEALAAPYVIEKPKNTFLSRLFFFADLAPEERLAEANKHLESIQEVRKNLKAVESQIKGRADRYQYLCYSFGVRYYDDLVRNVSRIVRELENDEFDQDVRSSKRVPRGAKKGRGS
ncbi:MAG: PadR family transcriptional regulator [Deltaproteobacteria bacterium HGW-Deltaproteobacteria-21]|nr:MAG: PadR family transcriptional regulator [Deltaproteobacteria bacterium HGW-Deltaproteobacteria-21]